MQVAGRKGPFEIEVILFPGRQGIELHHLHAEEIGQVVRIPGVRSDAIFVDQAGIERADQRAAILHIKLEPVGLAPASRWSDGAMTSLYRDRSSAGRAKSTGILRSCSAL